MCINWLKQKCCSQYSNWCFSFWLLNILHASAISSSMLRHGATWISLQCLIHLISVDSQTSCDTSNSEPGCTETSHYWQKGSGSSMAHRETTVSAGTREPIMATKSYDIPQHSLQCCAPTVVKLLCVFLMPNVCLGEKGRWHICVYNTVFWWNTAVHFSSASLCACH